MDLIELGLLSDEQYAEVVGDEADPWHAEQFNLEWLPKDRHVALLDDSGRLCAVAGLVVVEVQFGGREPVPVVGLGGVIVTATRRGRGFGRRVISEALTRAEETGPAIAMLFCRPELASLYRRHGFAEIREPVLVDQSAGVVDISAFGLAMWRPLKPGAQLPDGLVKVNGLPF